MTTTTNGNKSMVVEEVEIQDDKLVEWMRMKMNALNVEGQRREQRLKMKNYKRKIMILFNSFRKGEWFD